LITPGITISLISTGSAAAFVISRFPRQYVLGSFNFDLKYGTAGYFLRAGRIYASKRPLAVLQTRGETAYMTRQGPNTEDDRLHRWNNLLDRCSASICATDRTVLFVPNQTGNAVEGKVTRMTRPETQENAAMISYMMTINVQPSLDALTLPVGQLAW
jgi:hypothetical protein